MELKGIIDYNEANIVLIKKINENKLNISDFNEAQIKELTYSIMEGLDITDWMNPSFDVRLMNTFCNYEIFGYDYNEFIPLSINNKEKFISIYNAKRNDFYTEELLNENISSQLIEMILYLDENYDFEIDYNEWIREGYSIDEAIKELWDLTGYYYEFGLTGEEQLIDNEKRIFTQLRLFNKGIFIQELYSQSINNEKLKLIEKGIELGLYNNHWINLKNDEIKDIIERGIREYSYLNIDNVDSYVTHNTDPDYNRKKEFIAGLLILSDRNINLTDNEIRNLDNEKIKLILRNRSIYWRDLLDNNLDLSEFKEEIKNRVKMRDNFESTQSEFSEDSNLFQ